MRSLLLTMAICSTLSAAPVPKPERKISLVVGTWHHTKEGMTDKWSFDARGFWLINGETNLNQTWTLTGETITLCQRGGDPFTMTIAGDNFKLGPYTLVKD